jgi:Flp pilus assembly protein CpaB
VRFQCVNDVDSFVIPGTHVDVLLTGSPGRGSEKQATHWVLENLAVLAAEQKLERNSAGEPQTVAVITLLVSFEDVQRLTLASSEGRIHMMPPKKLWPGLRVTNSTMLLTLAKQRAEEVLQESPQHKGR